MSYLLDAIRKAEKQRNHDTVPTLEGLVQERRAAAGRGRGRWLIWVSLVVVLAASVYLNQQLVARWLDTGKTTVATLASKLTGLWQEDTSPPKNSNSGESAQPNQPSQSSAQPQQSRLTDAQRSLIGQIEFTVLSYSTDDDKRFVMVGSRVLREGDLLEGFEIRRIQQDGVVILVNGKSVLVRP